MSDPRIAALEQKQEKTLEAISSVATELHGLTIELRRDREETAALRHEIDAIKEDVKQLQINQAVLKDLKGAIGKAVYIMAGGFASILFAGILAAIKLIG